MAQRRPWIKRKVGQARLWVWMPYEGGSNREWILGELSRRVRPEWNKQARRWEIARRHLWVLAEAMAQRFGEVDLFMEFSETEKCDRRCQEATETDVSECVCSCFGKYHGGFGDPRADWKLVGATTLVASGPLQVKHMVIRRPLAPGPDNAFTSQPLPQQPAVSTQLLHDVPEPSASGASTATGSTDVGRDGEGSERAAEPPPVQPVGRAAEAERLPAGCGIAMFLTTVIVSAIFALAVHGLFWMGAALAILFAVAFGAERIGLL